MQTERVVAKDNTVAIGDQNWQLEKSRFRSSLAGCTVTIHEHLDRPFPSASARMSSAAMPGNTAGEPWKRRARGNRGKPKPGFPPLPPPLGNPPKTGIPTFPPLRRQVFILKAKTGKPPSASRRGSTGLAKEKPDRSCVNETGHLDLLQTGGSRDQLFSGRQTPVQASSLPSSGANERYPC